MHGITAGSPQSQYENTDQLHIHMAGISNAVVAQLNQAGVKKNDLNGWKSKLVKITSKDSPTTTARVRSRA